MKAVLEADLFAELARWPASVSPTRTPLESIMNLRLSCQHGEFGITGTDMERWVQAAEVCDEPEDGVAVVPAAFIRHVAPLLKGHVIVRATDSKLDIACEGFHLATPTLPPDAMPIIPMVDGQSSVTMDHDSAKRLVACTLFCGTDSRYLWSSVLFDFSQGLACGSDGNGMAIASLPRLDGRILVPDATAKLLGAYTADAPVTLAWDENRVSFSDGRVSVVGLLRGGNYPDAAAMLERVRGAGGVTKTVTTRELRLAADRALVSCNDLDRSMTIRYSGRECILAASHASEATASFLIQDEEPAEAVMSRVDAHLFRRMLKPYPCETVKLTLQPHVGGRAVLVEDDTLTCLLSQMEER